MLHHNLNMPHYSLDMPHHSLNMPHNSLNMPQHSLNMPHHSLNMDQVLFRHIWCLCADISVPFIFLHFIDFIIDYFAVETWHEVVVKPAGMACILKSRGYIPTSTHHQSGTYYLPIVTVWSCRYKVIGHKFQIHSSHFRVWETIAVILSGVPVNAWWLCLTLSRLT